MMKMNNSGQPMIEIPAYDPSAWMQTAFSGRRDSQKALIIPGFKRPPNALTKIGKAAAKLKIQALNKTVG